MIKKIGVTNDPKDQNRCGFTKLLENFVCHDLA